MVNLLFISAMATGCAGMIYWGCMYLPAARWQMLAAVPVEELEAGDWRGINFTFYGLLSANAYGLALLLLVVLLAAVAVPLPLLLVLAAGLLGICVPASRWVARWVEGKAHTFTVGGAAFVGVVVAPWLVIGLNQLVAVPLAVMPTLAALGIAYALGEGLGRLACISFGCCYGKPLADCSPLLQRLFARCHFVFSGATKKISYASGLNGQAVVPIQAITAILYVGCAIFGTILFVNGAFRSAFLLTALTTQGWRVYSETLRADYRGQGTFSLYQWMGMVGMIYVGVVAWLTPSPAVAAPQLAIGLAALWNPALLLVVQGLWLALFWYTGKSTVTGAQLRFHVYSERI